VAPDVPVYIGEAEAQNPERIVPIHSTAADRFQDWLPRVERRQDQEVWQV